MKIILANKLLEINRKSDLISRWGGEEFVVLLPDTNIDGATIIAEKIRKNIQDLILPINTKKIKFTISIGVAEFDIKENDLEASLNRADKALYEAKETGRNKVCVN